MKTLNKYLSGIALVLPFINVHAQAPTISYTTPQTWTVGTPVSLSPTLGGGAISPYQYPTTTFAGSTAGYADGTGTAAKFNLPAGIAIDASGNMYIGDAVNNRIREISPAGVVTTFAGSGTAGSTDGQGTAASFYDPIGVAADASGNLYVVDRGNNKIRKITPGGLVSTLAGSGTAGSTDGQGTAASFNTPGGLAVDAAGNVYVGDCNNNKIRKITPAGLVSTYAGTGTQGATNGPAASATFYKPCGIAVDGAGNVYVADWYNHLIREISASGTVSTLAGTTAGFADGIGTVAKFNYPVGIAIDAGGTLYVTDEHNNRIRTVSSSGYVTTISGNGTAGSTNGNGTSAEFNEPFAIAVDSTGFVSIADYGNSQIRRVAFAPLSIAPHLPPNVNFSASTGVISGTPTTTSAATNYTVTAYNTYGTGTATVNITINNAPAGSQGQSLNQNYVMTNVPRIAGITNDSTLAVNYGVPANLQTGIQYVDGLGRPIQTIQVQASPLGNDMVQPQAYDQFDRQPTKYLPYTPQTGTTGSYRINALNGEQNTFYASPPSGANFTPIADPYAQTNFDNSPLDRPTEQGAPGVPWQLSTTGIVGSGHTVKMVYTVNNATSFTTDSVNGKQAALYYTVINSDNSQTLTADGYYAANTLTVTVAKDENWVSGRGGTVEEYKDIDGHVVLKRQYNYIAGALQMLSTYYVYDDLGRLAFVLPPASGADAATSISSTTLNNLCYQYQYDGLNRRVQKKLPGKAWDYIVYNNMDQPVATQDGNQRDNEQWIITKYDGLQRPALTGIWTNNNTAISRSSLQSTLTGITTNLYETQTTTGNGYTNAAWPTTYVTTTLSLNYYDSYANAPGLPYTTAPTGANLATRGQLVATLTNVLQSSNMLWTAHYYDNWGRLMTGYAQHYLGGTLNNNNYDQISTTYNFTNAPTTVTRKHYTSATTSYPLVTIFNKYIYDNVGRKLKTWEQITNTNQTADYLTLISQANYNEIGQIYKKQLQSTDSISFQQSIGYNYNERGWLLGSNAPLFQMQLQYNIDSLSLGISKQYNGNIASQGWGISSAKNTSSYVYTYDQLNRITAGTGSAGNTENNISYDLMGNISALNRYATSTKIDQLTYTYSSTNQLQNVNDGSGNNSGMIAGTTLYGYDDNGNMLSATNSANHTNDKNFTYNLINLPLVATVPSGTITYTYDAAGNKLRKVSTVNSNSTDYISGIQYDGATTPALSFILTEEGKAVPISGTTHYDYTYFLGDNLGNTRVTFDTKTGSAAITQKDDYYPFGMDINVTPGNPKNKYLYNKKEIQDEITEYDYGARFYDPVIARWTSIDPLAEVNRRWSPYNYVSNNPIRFIDPDGMEGWDEMEELTNSNPFATDNDKRIADEKSDSRQAEAGAPNTSGDYAAANAATQTGQCCSTPQQDHTATAKTGTKKKVKKATNAELAKDPGPSIILNGKRVYIKDIDQSVHVNWDGSTSQTTVRVLSNEEALAFLNSQIETLKNLGTYLFEVTGFTAPTAIGAKSAPAGVALSTVFLRYGHNFSNLSDELQATAKAISNTSIGLIEITTVSSSGPPNREDESTEVNGSTKYYNSQTGQIINTATTNGN